MNVIQNLAGANKQDESEDKRKVPGLLKALALGAAGFGLYKGRNNSTVQGIVGGLNKAMDERAAQEPYKRKEAQEQVDREFSNAYREAVLNNDFDGARGAIRKYSNASPTLLNRAASEIFTRQKAQADTDYDIIDGVDSKGRPLSGDKNIPSHLSAESQTELRQAVANQAQRAQDAKDLKNIDPLGSAQALRDVGRTEVADAVADNHIAELEQKAQAQRDRMLEEQADEQDHSTLVDRVAQNPALFKMLTPSQKTAILPDLPQEALKAVMESPRTPEDQEAFALRRAELIRKFATRKDVRTVQEAEAIVDRLMGKDVKGGSGDPTVDRAVGVLKGLSADEQRQSLKRSQSLSDEQKKRVRELLGLDEQADAGNRVFRALAKVGV